MRSDNSSLAKDCRKDMKAANARLLKLGRKVCTTMPLGYTTGLLCICCMMQIAGGGDFDIVRCAVTQFLYATLSTRLQCTHLSALMEYRCRSILWCVMQC